MFVYVKLMELLVQLVYLFGNLKYTCYLPTINASQYGAVDFNINRFVFTCNYSYSISIVFVSNQVFYRLG